MSLQKVTITRISRKPKVSTRTGKPFTSLGLLTQEHGEKWLSGFGSVSNQSWNIGDTVEIDVVEKNGYLNFETPKAADAGPAASNAATAELKNLIELRIGKQLTEILARLDRIDYKLGKEEGEEMPFPDFGEEEK